MKTSKFWISAGLVAVALMLSVSAMAATDAWIGLSSSSAKIAGDTYVLANGASKQFSLYFTSAYDFNVADFVVGFDKSTSSAYGDGLGSAATGKLSLTSTTTSIKNSIGTNNFTVDPEDPDQIHVPVYDMTNKVTLGTGREVSALYGGNVYGFDVIASKSVSSVAAGTTKLINFTIKSNLAAGDFQYITISNAAQYDTSWTSAMKHGSDYEIPSSYSLKITSGVVPEPGTIVSLLGGLVGLAGVALRRRS